MKRKNKFNEFGMEMTDSEIEDGFQDLASEIYGKPKAKIKKGIPEQKTVPPMPRPAAGDSENVRNCPEVSEESEESEKVAQSNTNTKKELPAPVKNALLGYIDMLESDIMDIAEAIAERTEKMNELKTIVKVVKDYIREIEHD